MSRVETAGVCQRGSFFLPGDRGLLGSKLLHDLHGALVGPSLFSHVSELLRRSEGFPVSFLHGSLLLGVVHARLLVHCGLGSVIRHCSWGRLLRQILIQLQLLRPFAFLVRVRRYHIPRII